METSDTISLVFVRHGRSVAQGEKGSRRMRAELRDASLASYTPHADRGWADERGGTHIPRRRRTIVRFSSTPRRV